MSKTKRYIQSKAVEKIPASALGVLGSVIVNSAEKAAIHRWDKALERAAAADGDSVEQRANQVVRAFRSELTKVGAVTGAVAAAPVVGTTAAMGSIAVDLAWFAMRTADLIMSIGAVYGFDESTPEQRRSWIMSILAYGDEAADQMIALMADITESAQIDPESLRDRLFTLLSSDAVTVDALRRANTVLAAQVAKKFGARRSVLAVGRLLPFGVGAVIGGSANWAFARTIGNQSRRFFQTIATAELPN